MTDLNDDASWGFAPWHCEDCGAEGEDFAVPDECPVCRSLNTTSGRALE